MTKLAVVITHTAEPKWQWVDHVARQNQLRLTSNVIN